MDRKKRPQKCIHAGHRSRMRHRFLRNGLDGFSDHEVLELLLFYAVPRQDVNPMAHALLDRFGSLPEVLDAPVEELCTIHGVGPKVARFLTLIPDILFQTEYRLLSPSRASLRTPEDLCAIMSQRLTPPAPGDTYVIILDISFTTLATYAFSVFDELDVRELALLSLRHNSRHVVLAECVSDLSVLPAPSRVEALVTLQRALGDLDIRLVDYYRFCPDCSAPRSAARDGLLLPRG